MQDALKKAIEATAKKAAEANTADEALKYTQAALNAAHALITVANEQRNRQ